LLMRGRHRSRRPVSVEFGPKRIFVLQPLGAIERGFLERPH
jgi:hypothetical protein